MQVGSVAVASWPGWLPSIAPILPVTIAPVSPWSGCCASTDLSAEQLLAMVWLGIPLQWSRLHSVVTSRGTATFLPARQPLLDLVYLLELETADLPWWWHSIPFCSRSIGNPFCSAATSGCSVSAWCSVTRCSHRSSSLPPSSLPASGLPGSFLLQLGACAALVAISPGGCSQRSTAPEHPSRLLVSA